MSMIGERSPSASTTEYVEAKTIVLGIPGYGIICKACGTAFTYEPFGCHADNRRDLHIGNNVTLFDIVAPRSIVKGTSLGPLMFCCSRGEAELLYRNVSPEMYVQLTLNDVELRDNQVPDGWPATSEGNMSYIFWFARPAGELLR